MRQYRWIIALTQTLRVVLVTALMLLVPMTEASHAMPIGTTMSMTDHDMVSGHDMAMPDKTPISHGTDATSCRILCLGWVQASEAIRPEAPVLSLIASLAVDHFVLPEGIPPSPIGHPPKITPVL
jgi:hypothetical protein